MHIDGGDTHKRDAPRRAALPRKLRCQSCYQIANAKQQLFMMVGARRANSIGQVHPLHIHTQPKDLIQETNLRHQGRSATKEPKAHLQ